MQSVPKKGSGAVENTAILDSLFYSTKIINGDACRRAFNTADLSARGIKRLLDREKADKHLPDFAGIDVWIIGATPHRNMASSRIRQIEKFWQAYFTLTGASLGSQHYGPALMNFHLNRSRVHLTGGDLPRSASRNCLGS